MLPTPKSKTMFLAVLCLVTALAAPAAAESILREIGNHPFHCPPLTSIGEFRSMMDTRRDDLMQGFARAGHADLYPALERQLPAAKVESVRVAPGETFEWMLFRRNGKGPVRVSRNLVWGGKASFEAYRFFVDDGGKRYAFVVPTGCGNVALKGVGPVPPPPAATAPEPEPEPMPAQAPPANRAPDCRLTVSAPEVTCGERFTVSAETSTDADGTVASVVFRLVDPQGRTVRAAADDRRPFVQEFTAPCDARRYTIQAVAVDDDGAESDPSACSAAIAAKRPPGGGPVVDVGAAHQFDPATYLFGRVGYEVPLTQKLYLLGMVGGFGRVSGDDSGSAFVADLTLNHHWTSGFSAGVGLGFWAGDDDGPVDEDADQLDVIGNVGYRVWGDPRGVNATLFFEIRAGTDEFDELDDLARYGFGLRLRF